MQVPARFKKIRRNYSTVKSVPSLFIIAHIKTLKLNINDKRYKTTKNINIQTNIFQKSNPCYLS